jgi:hypothetical protein
MDCEGGSSSVDVFRIGIHEKSLPRGGFFAVRRDSRLTLPGDDSIRKCMHLCLICSLAGSFAIEEMH